MLNLIAGHAISFISGFVTNIIAGMVMDAYRSRRKRKRSYVNVDHSGGSFYFEGNVSDEDAEMEINGDEFIVSGRNIDISQF